MNSYSVNYKNIMRPALLINIILFPFLFTANVWADEMALFSAAGGEYRTANNERARLVYLNQAFFQQFTPDNLLSEEDRVSSLAHKKNKTQVVGIVSRHSVPLDEHWIGLPLFDGRVVELDFHGLKVYSGSHYVLTGKIKNIPLSTVVFLVNDGRISAHIDTAGDTYTLHTLSNGHHRLLQENHSDYLSVNENFPSDGIVLPSKKPLSKYPQNTNQTLLSKSSVAQLNPDFIGPIIIDVMILYNQNAKADAIAEGIDGGIEEELRLYFEVANQALVNSDVNVEFRLVHLAEVDYPDRPADCNGLATYLTELGDQNDNVLEQVHDMRDTYGADIVSLIMGEYCSAAGIGYLGSPPRFDNAPLGFNIVVRDSLDDYVLAHEIGHNLSANHDQYQFKIEYDLNNAIPLTAYEGFNYGYTNISAQALSIMAYQRECADNGLWCHYLPYFSSSTVQAISLSGDLIAFGREDVDNARSINEAAESVAEYLPDRNIQPVSGHIGWQDEVYLWEMEQDSETQTYSLKAPDLNDSQVSARSYQADFAAGNVSFDVQVSSERDWDFFHFYIDDQLQDRWSGSVNWQQRTYALTAGSHRLRWVYAKDSNTSEGLDRAWIRNITLPLVNNLADKKLSSPSVYGAAKTTSVEFYGGTTISGQDSYGSVFAADDKLDVNGMLTVESSHLGKQAHLLALFVISGEGFMHLNEQGVLESWELFNFSQLYLGTIKVLDSMEYLHILDNYQPARAGYNGKSFSVWFGYELVDEPGIIYFNGEAVVFSVQ